MQPRFKRGLLFLGLGFSRWLRDYRATNHPVTFELAQKSDSSEARSRAAHPDSRFASRARRKKAKAHRRPGVPLDYLIKEIFR
jgi:hypothetical protein